MSKHKWGESFLKSGLPLEHLTQVELRNLGWNCWPHFEYSRPNRERQETWFELDLLASHPKRNRDTELSVMVECKYHDLSRYWFFLPHHSTGRWCFDDRVLNCGPYGTLREPREDTFLSLAPMSSGGIVVSEDGTKQDNAVYTAVQQIVNAFLPCSLSHVFSSNLDFHNLIDPEGELRFKPQVTAMVPMMVTNAALYRLKPDVTDLDVIRAASAPLEVADEVPWTWYYHDVPMQLWNQNLSAIEAHSVKDRELVYRFPRVEAAMQEFADRPNWIAVVNIRALRAALTAILQRFLKLETNTVASMLRPRRSSES